jgi:DNA modification methylase
MTKHAVTPELIIRQKPVSKLKPNPRNARTHPKNQIRQIASSIKEFGFTNPILVDKADVVIAGHGRLAGAKLLGLSEVPTIALESLTPDQVRAYVLADNKLGQGGGWDNALLALELEHLLTLDDFEIELTGFEVPEVDLIVKQALDPNTGAAEIVELESGPAVSRTGDIWKLGKHRLICGNSRERSTFADLMQGNKADVVITDPPYNVRIDGNACGKGAVRHREFAMGSGEMSTQEFSDFLHVSLDHAAAHSRAGSIHYVFMDWRHMGELLEAGQNSIGEFLHLCIWVKDNGGMGSFYRSRHELVFLFKNGKKSHRNNIQLGRFGRNRTNVWEYPGVNTESRCGNENLLALHPTVKPVSLVADALLDCSARGDRVLDYFLGSGTTLLAAERVGRICFGIEIDPLYVDVAIRRWQRYTGEQAIHKDGHPFEESAALIGGDHEKQE